MIEMAETAVATTVEQMPQYQCHKVVRAAKIVSFTVSGDDKDAWVNFCRPDEDGLPPIEVSNADMVKHQPKIGWYCVQYEDGYVSFSPPEVFERGYTRVLEA